MFPNFQLRPLKNKFLRYCMMKRLNSWWSGVPMAPPDGIFGLVDAFNKDTNPNKLNLCVGAYRDDNGKPYVLPTVRKAESKIKAKNLDKEYSLMQGSEEYCKLSINFVLGECSDIVCEGLNATVQGVAGTGSLAICAGFLKRFFPGNNKIVYVPKPTWANHAPIFRYAGLETKFYRYLDYKTFGLDFKGALEDICKIPEKSIILFHVCAHNPSGVDPTKEEWCEISQLVKKNKLFTVFDFAYQGFASGDPDNDAFSIRQFAKDGNRFACAQTYSKNMGLYGERIGALTIIGDSKEEVEKIMSQLKLVIRSIYSNPPIHGARIVIEIMTDPKLKDEWMIEMKGMADRIITARRLLLENLKKEGSCRNWDHVTKQIGLFCYTGLNPEQVDKLKNEHGVYLTKDGRMSIAGVTSKNVEYLACVLHQVTK